MCRLLLVLLLAPAANAELRVWASPSEDKVLREELRGPQKNHLWDGKTVRIWGARNEVLSFSLVLESPKAVTRDVRVRLDSLLGPSGFALRSVDRKGAGLWDWRGRDIELFFVRYLRIRGLSAIFYEHYDERHLPPRLRRKHDRKGKGRGGWKDRFGADKHYPEIAVPMELVGDFDVASDRSQLVWVDIYVPKGAPEGTYRGTVEVSVGGKARSLPVELEVQPFVLPDEPTSKTMAYLGYANVNQRYLNVREPRPGPLADEASAILDRHFTLAHRHRIALIDENQGAAPWPQTEPRPAWKARLDGSLFTPMKGYDGPGIGVGNGVFSIGTYGHWPRALDDRSLQTWAEGWTRWFRVNSPGTEYFLYVADEAGDDAQMERWAKLLRGRLPTFATVPFPRAAKSVPSLDIAAARADIGPRKVWEDAVATLRERGHKVYLYNGRRPAVGSFAIEDEGVAPRQLPWAQHALGVDRWFYWETTYYENYQGGAGKTNVFRNARTFGTGRAQHPVKGESGWNYSNGDGVLFYPGTDKLFAADSYGVPGPFASLRMKYWRRGIQDVEYLALAARKDPQASQAILRKLVPKAAWEYGVTDPKDPTWVRTAASWPSSPKAWEDARRALRDIILKPTPPPSEGAKTP